MELSTADYPTVGPPDATHVMVLMADYTCPHCRVTHQTMARLLTNYGGQIALIVLPTPLCSACNREVPAGLGSPPVACALARLALAVWCANPRAFAPMDQWLFAEARPRTEAEARAFAVRLIGADALRRAEADPRIDHLLAANADLYGRLDRGLIPKLMWGNLIAQGAIADSWPLDEPIFRTWHIRPDGKPGASHPDAPAGR